VSGANASVRGAISATTGGSRLGNTSMSAALRMAGAAGDAQLANAQQQIGTGAASAGASHGAGATRIGAVPDG
jgi:hypothetical protein